MQESRNIPLTTNLISYLFRGYLDCQLKLEKQKKWIKKAKFLSDVSKSTVERVP